MLPLARQLQLALVGVVLAAGVVVLWRLVESESPPVAVAAPRAATSEPESLRVEADLDLDTERHRSSTSSDADASAEPLETSIERAAGVDGQALPRLPGIAGRVTDVLGYPLVGAQVTAQVRRASASTEIGTVLTDDRGRYRIAFDARRRRSDFVLPLPEGRDGLERARRDGPRRGPTLDAARVAMLNAPLELAVRATFRGYEPVEWRERIEEALPESLEIDLQLQPGSLIEGRVVASRLEWGMAVVPVGAAQVFLLDRRGELLKSTGTFDDGPYARGSWWLYLNEPGEYQLFARHPTLGTGYLAKLEIDPNVTSHMPDIAVRGEGELGGRVVYPDGKAVVALGLEARHELVELVAARVGAGLGEAQRIALELDRGLVLGNAVTGGFGEFHLQGLRPGEFELHVLDDPDPSHQPRERISTGDESIKVTYPGYRLHVWVLQAGASPADPAEIEVRKLGLDDDKEPLERLAGRFTDAGHWYATVAPGERYMVKAWASNQQFDWTVVDIAPASYETDAALALFGNFDPVAWAGVGGDEAKLRWSGRLELVVSDETGARFDGWSAKLTAADGTTPRGWSAAAPNGKGELPIVPPGTYQLDLSAAAVDSMLILAREPRRVVIRPGITACEEFRGRLGGRVRIRSSASLSLVERPPPAAPVADDLADTGTTDSRDRARAYWRAEDEPVGTRHPLLWRVEGEDASPSPVEWLPLGRSALGDALLAPGRYVVTVERDGEAGREFPVDVAGGKHSEIDFTP